MAANAGADGITAHLREDRRHISDADIFRLKAAIALPLNLEMAATPEMLDIALKNRPNACCIVPEKRQEITTEGGLDVVRDAAYLKPYVDKLLSANIRVSLFVDPEANQIEAAHALNATIVELHTGMYCHATGQGQLVELKRIQASAALCVKLGLECHAGHGLSFDTVGPIAAIPQIVELNIGHFLIGEAIFTGVESAIAEMRRRMDAAR